MIWSVCMISVHRTYDGKYNKGRMSTDMFHVIGITVDTSNWTQSDSNKVGKNSSIIERKVCWILYIWRRKEYGWLPEEQKERNVVVVLVLELDDVIEGSNWDTDKGEIIGMMGICSINRIVVSISGLTLLTPSELERNFFFDERLEK